MVKRRSAVLIVGLLVAAAPLAAQSRLGPDWSTNTNKRTISFGELMSGGPPKDGIPAIDEPRFVSQRQARRWIAPQEPILVVVLNGEAKGYPLQILTWHEIVNDAVGGVPVSVTFCPLCYSAVVFERQVGDVLLDFGVSGFLRNSDLVMFDRQTETLWQQLTGEAIMGDYVGTTLTPVPAQLISFAQFQEAYPDAKVLSRRTGHTREYGTNPYAGYDDIENTPFLYDGPTDDRLLPMEKVIAVSRSGLDVAYPHRITRARTVLHDQIGGESVVVFHTSGAVSALDEQVIHQSKEDGSTGVFLAQLDGRTLTFRAAGDGIADEETGSTWSITGKAVAGPLKGEQLTAITHGNYFAFAWLAFKPESTVFAE
ncbi:MAG: DUF3179 domain-containing protein [Bacteroidota bacterium]